MTDPADPTVLTAAADGSALGNPGPAGWAWYVDEECWAAGGWKHGTNNMGELKAVLDLVEATAHLPETELHILCDSQYVINCITRWMPGWKRKGWKKADGKPVMNRDLLESLDQALAGRKYRFEWVKGHAGHPLNEAADLRARGAATAYQKGREPETGPGLGHRGSGAAGARNPARAGPATAAPATSTTPGKDSTRGQEGRTRDAEPARTIEEHPAAGPELSAAACDRQLDARANAADVEGLRSLLAEGLVWITARGRQATRAAVLKFPEKAFAGSATAEVLETTEVAAGTELVTCALSTAQGRVLRTSLWGTEASGQRVLLARQHTLSS